MVDNDKNKDSKLGNKISGFSQKLNDYLYPVINTINNEDENGNIEFTIEEIERYNLNIINNKIDISTSKKLINYLKSFTKKSIKHLNEKLNELDNKLDIEDYVIDNDLDEDSENPISNKCLSNKFKEIEELINNKSNIVHSHSIDDVSNFDEGLTWKLVYTAPLNSLDSSNINLERTNGVLFFKCGNLVLVRYYLTTKKFSNNVLVTNRNVIRILPDFLKSSLSSNFNINAVDASGKHCMLAVGEGLYFRPYESKSYTVTGTFTYIAKNTKLSDE